MEFIKQLFKKWKGGKGMKTLFVGLLFAVLVMPLAQAEGEGPITLPSEFTAKQGMLMLWSDQHLQHSTTFEAAYTEACPSWPKWANALWSGWTIDVGFAYDASSADNAVLGISRTVGTLKDYLPIKFPILEKFKISITPLTLEARHFTTDLDWDGATGGSYANVSVKF